MLAVSLLVEKLPKLGCLAGSGLPDNDGNCVIGSESSEQSSRETIAKKDRTLVLADHGHEFLSATKRR